MSSRRKFLQGAALGGSLLGLAPVSVLASMDRADNPDLSFDRFGALIGSNFALLDDDDCLCQLRLVRLRPIEIDDRVEQFQLFFEQSSSGRFSERSYRLQHASLGRISLFLQPISDAGQSWACRSDLCLLR